MQPCEDIVPDVRLRDAAQEQVTRQGARVSLLESVYGEAEGALSDPQGIRWKRAGRADARSTRVG